MFPLTSTKLEPSPPEQDDEGDGDDKGGGILDRVKDFIHDVGEKIEDAVSFGKPTADVAAIHILSVDLKQADIVADVLITNPNPIPIPLVDINYLVESDGRKLVSGLVPDAGTVHAHASQTINIPVRLVYQDIRSAYEDLDTATAIPYRVLIELIVDVPVIGQVSIAVEAEGEVPVTNGPDVELEKIKLERFSLEETSAVLHLRIENKNGFDLGVNSVDYEVWLAEVRIGGARMEESAAIGGNGSGTVRIPMTFRPKDFGSAVWDIVRGKGAGYSIKGSIDVDTPFGPMNLPFIKEGGTTRIKQADDDSP